MERSKDQTEGTTVKLPAKKALPPLTDNLNCNGPVEYALLLGIWIRAFEEEVEFGSS